MKTIAKSARKKKRDGLKSNSEQIKIVGNALLPTKEEMKSHISLHYGKEARFSGKLNQFFI